jgi:hypothetical protein
VKEASLADTLLQSWADAACRRLAKSLPADFYVGSAEFRTDTYVDLREASVGLKVRDAASLRPLVELKLRSPAGGRNDVTFLPGLELWDKVLVARSDLVGAEGILDENAVGPLLKTRYTNVMKMFEVVSQDTDRSVPVVKVRVQCVGGDVKIEAAEVQIDRLRGTVRELWRSVCVEGPREHTVRDCVLSQQFRNTLQSEQSETLKESAGAARLFYGGYPEWIAAFPR